MTGLADEDLTTAQFLDPVDVKFGNVDNVAYVSDDNHIRRIVFRAASVTIQGIESANRVVTIAGGAIEGLVDGKGPEALLNRPNGIAATSDGILYTSSPISCKIRRISTAVQVDEPVTCATTAYELVNPSV